MNNQTKDIDTSKAWDALHARLEEDRLLFGNQKATIDRKFVYRRAAAVIVLLLACAWMVYWWTGIRRDTTWYTQHNKDVSNTLVTLLEDGSVVYLGGQASLDYPEKFEPDKREVRMKGDALFDVSKDKIRPFFIETEQVRIEVLGTAFRVRSGDEQSHFELSVERGQVRVTQKDNGKQMVVNAGEMVRLQSEFWEKEEVKSSVLFDPYTDKMRFKDERLEDIIRVINATVPRPIVLEKGLENRTLTVTFDEHAADSMAKLIGLALQLNCTERDGAIYISR